MTWGESWGVSASNKQVVGREMAGDDYASEVRRIAQEEAKGLVHQGKRSLKGEGFVVKNNCISRSQLRWT